MAPPSPSGSDSAANGPTAGLPPGHSFEAPRSKREARPGPSGLRPSGRDEVVEAVLAAARKLIAQKGPSGVSLRDIETEAGVNKGLVYMYVGTKEQLVNEVWRRAALDTATRMSEIDDVEHGIALLMHHPGLDDVRLMAWAALEADDPGALFGPAASLGLLADVVRRNADAKGIAMSDAQARVSVAIAAMVATAWRVLGPVARTSAGVGPDETALFDEQVAQVMSTVLYSKSARPAGQSGAGEDPS